ncbi:hypothetical protein H5410_046942 [Solanum commersonii]|uniref:Uncharacterized protein n=1 Tax=Solanum commersonii TaxID=4109 RepID=A0A9J5XGW8_SOLCO|nr:hypothetical protein H5410_046942 [Solanum commersonii]
MVVVELNEIVVANTISPLCFLLAQERGRKTKITKLMAESEWAKVEDVLHGAIRGSREIELIRDTCIERCVLITQTSITHTSTYL